jgi:hypothetical protein
METIPLTESNWNFAKSVLEYKFASDCEDYNDFYLYETEGKLDCIYMEQHLTEKQNLLEKQIICSVPANTVDYTEGCNIPAETLKKTLKGMKRSFLNETKPVKMLIPIVDSGIGGSMSASESAYPKLITIHAKCNSQLAEKQENSHFKLSIKNNLIDASENKSSSPHKSNSERFWQEHFAFQDTLKTKATESRSSVSSFCGDFFTFLDNVSN